jgi:hypothetical protein
MAKPEWGVKRQCAGCGVRFYDLMHDPIACPECGAVYEVAALVRGKRTRPSAGRADAAKKVVLVEEADELDIDVDIEDEAEDDTVLDDVDADEDVEDVAVPPVAGAVAGDDDDALEADDSVLIEDDEDEDVALDDFVEDEEEDDTRR